MFQYRMYEKIEMGRKKEFNERIDLPLRQGTVARIDAALDDDEVRLNLIRDAIERELERRSNVANDRGTPK